MTALVANALELPAHVGAAPRSGQDDDPRRELAVGGLAAAAFFVLFLGWAALAPLDAAAVAPGRLQVLGQRQSVQHRDGGIVSAIRVHEGQSVSTGQVLIQLAGNEVRAQERALAAQMLNLILQQRRLEAEQSGASQVNWPTNFPDLSFSPAELHAAIAVQDKEFAARRSLLSAQLHVLQTQAAQSRETATGYGSQMISSTEQERLINEELSSLQSVAAEGFVSQSRIRALERARADLQGQKGQYHSNVAQAHLSAGTTQLRQIEAERGFHERAASEAKQVASALAELTPRYYAAYGQVQRLLVRAPATGTVVGLSVFTVNGVIGPGQRLMDIVPERAELVVAAQLSPDDVDDVRTGQKSELRFVGLHDRGLPVLSGTLTRISADALSDERRGTSYYSAEFRVPASEIAKIREVRGPSFQLRAGSPVEAIVPVRKRTALDYAFEPLREAMTRSGTEH